MVFIFGEIFHDTYIVWNENNSGVKCTNKKEKKKKEKWNV